MQYVLSGEPLGNAIEHCYRRALVDWRKAIAPKLELDEALALRFNGAEINCLIKGDHTAIAAVTIAGINSFDTISTVFKLRQVKPREWVIDTDSLPPS